ncbi:PREDICTED: uncharacterized protein LOC105362817 [Ceratosolen solmsi marchali]|uniref:Uncharacterized protein LOC105362817 n=1 Tax=Ceratosolen solmsi marchali TaxID=326594 RepID=A0AAJ7DW54_9HYME|nr:PREDICTED: uncharacterized protein LOC105362817 [Ceratosolen solmsi marchali]
MNSRSKKWYDSNRKLTSLRFSDKKNQQNENNATRSSNKKSSNICQNFFVNEELKSQKRQGEKHVTDKLPSIYLQRNRNNNYHANSSMYVLSNNCKIRSTTTRERPTQGLSPRKPSAYIRSPMTKITKREANDYHFHSTSFDSSRLSLRKSYEQKFKYNAN